MRLVPQQRTTFRSVLPLLSWVSSTRRTPRCHVGTPVVRSGRLLVLSCHVGGGCGHLDVAGVDAGEGVADASKLGSGGIDRGGEREPGEGYDRFAESASLAAF